MMSYLREQKAKKARDAEEQSYATEWATVSKSLKVRQRRFVLVSLRKRRGRRNKLVKCIDLKLKSGIQRYSFFVRPDDMIELSFGSRQPAKVEATFYGISSSWVTTLRSFVADAYLTYQGWALGQLVSFARDRPPLFTMARLAFDETGEN